MEFVILTGLSGAGKTRAMHAMEDIGFYCVDNLPPALIPVFYDLCDKSEGIQRRVAVVTDTRGGELFKSFFSALETLKAQNKPYKILFMDASEPVLVNRFQETRRKHPLSEVMQCTVMASLSFCKNRSEMRAFSPAAGIFDVSMT